MKRFKYFWDWTRKQNVLFTIFVAVLVVPNFVLFYTEYTSLLTRVINIILPLSVFWFLMTLAKKPGIVMWSCAIFLFFNAFQMVLFDLFGKAVIAVDMFLNLATTNSGEASELLQNILPALIAVCVVYVVTLSLATISILNKKKLKHKFVKRQRELSAYLFALSLIGIIVNYSINPDFKIRNDIYPVNVCYNVVLAVERDIKTRNYAETSADFHFEASATRDKEEREVYVYVMGETMRAQNLGIYGYSRNTTPELAKLANLVVYRDALTQSNTTHKSVPMLMSGISAENYEEIYNQKSIFTAYKEAGFATIFFSNQRPSGSFIDFFADEADKAVFIKENLPTNANVYDLELVERVKKELETNPSKKIFIMLHTYGSHFNYYERYPKEFAKFKPDRVVSAGFKYRETLMNSYDNSIAYTDMLLSNLIKIVDKTASISAVIFASDHGEDMYDDSRTLFLHASPVPTVYQLHVPYMIWFSDIYKDKYPQVISAAKSNVDKPVSTSSSVFHTLLNISGIETKYLDKRYSVVDSMFVPKQRVYINDHNEPMPLNKIGLIDKDEIIFKKNNLVYP